MRSSVCMSVNPVYPPENLTMQLASYMLEGNENILSWMLKHSTACQMCDNATAINYFTIILLCNDSKFGQDHNYCDRELACT